MSSAEIEALISGVVDLFPDIREDYAAELVRQHRDLNTVCDLVLENPMYPTESSARKQREEREGHLMALRLNEDEYEREGQLIGCGCCYGEFAFEEMTQCSDGHLFCKECLVTYAQEAVFGAGRPELSCMEGGCTSPFPPRELERVLPGNILQKYYERQAEEAVGAACGDQLARCPSCDFPALLDDNVLQFSCPNPECLQESCRKCRVPWGDDHEGKTCEQAAEADVTRTRVLFEERMTEARVRKCAACGASLVKADGCNRVTCRCGQWMCYLCRKPITADYKHFCLHSQTCGSCKDKCPAFSDPEQDDERLIQEIQKEGEAELNKTSPQHRSRKRVGPPVEKTAPTPAKITNPFVNVHVPHVPHVPQVYVPQVPHVAQLQQQYPFYNIYKYF